MYHETISYLGLPSTMDVVIVIEISRIGQYK